MADRTELRGIVRIRFYDGKLEDFKRLLTECMKIMRVKDTGTLQYDIYFNDDESECVFLEHFSDSDALIDHNDNLGDVRQAMLDTGTVTGELFGAPSERLQAMFTDAPVRFHKLFRSFEPVVTPSQDRER